MKNPQRSNAFVDWTVHLDLHDQPVLVCASCEQPMQAQQTQWRCAGCRQTVPRAFVLGLFPAAVAARPSAS